jgi:hypothetical protein
MNLASAAFAEAAATCHSAAFGHGIFGWSRIRAALRRAAEPLT